MKDKFNTNDAEQVHLAGVFHEDGMEDYDKDKVRDYIQTMLEDEGLVYDSVVILDSGEGKVTVQTRMSKSTMNKETLDVLEDIYSAMDGYIELWVLTESVMRHPEIFK